IIINVLGNDSDPDGDPLTISSFSILQGKPGNLYLGETPGTLVFDPGDGYASIPDGETVIIEIAYTVQDGHGGEDSAFVTITLTGKNDAPVADDMAASVTEDAGATLAFLASDPDQDGAALTF